MTTNILFSPVDGLKLSLIYAEPEGAPKGIVQIAHGMCEHKERYIPLMEFLASNGFAAVCHDHRGHGASVKSPEDLGYMGKGGWLAMVDDAKAVTDWAKARWPGREQLYPEILRRKLSGDYGPEFRETYGVPLWQEQTGDPGLAPKGHFIARTMISVEALSTLRPHPSLK